MDAFERSTSAAASRCMWFGRLVHGWLYHEDERKRTTWIAERAGLRALEMHYGMVRHWRHGIVGLRDARGGMYVVDWKKFDEQIEAVLAGRLEAVPIAADRRAQDGVLRLSVLFLRDKRHDC